jgi:hypothetical protein
MGSVKPPERGRVECPQFDGLENLECGAVKSPTRGHGEPFGLTGEQTLLTHSRIGVKFGAMYAIDHLKRRLDPNFFGMIEKLCEIRESHPAALFFVSYERTGTCSNFPA